METYWTQYCDTGETGMATDSVTDSCTGDYYIYPYYDRIYPDWYPSYPYYVSYVTYPVGNKKERAYEILKVLVKDEIIPEPKSFKKFCDLIEKIAKVI